MKNGFTLVEMIAVLVILSILFVLSFTPLSKILKVGNDKISTAQDTLIKDALKEYSKNNNSKKKLTYYNCVSLENLVNDGYIESKFLNGINLDQSISFIKKNNTVEYEIVNNKCDDSSFEYQFSLIGNEEETLEYGNTYEEKGVNATVYGYDVSDEVTTKYFDENHNEIESINSNIKTVYFVEYTLTIDENSEKYDTLERIIKVVNSDKPRITYPTNVQINDKVTTYDILKNVTAVDKNNKALKLIVKTNLSLGVPGVYTVTYKATDEFGNTMISNRIITVIKSILYKESILYGADPVLDDSMIPVNISDNGTVKKADLYSEWYKYDDNDNSNDNSKWANAVITTTTSRDSYKGANANTPINQSDIIAYLVWIPRYSYVIPTVSDKSNPPLIKIQFENKGDSKKTGDATGENYYTHPAFTFDDKELDGIWVAKFETTGTASEPTVLPNVASLANQTVSDEFTTAQSFKTKYGISGD